MHARFGYCFMTPPGSEYPPILNEHRLVPGKPVTIEGDGGPVTALPVLQDHGDIPSLGFRFGDVAYSADLNGMPRRERRRRLPGSICGSWTRCAIRRIRAICRCRETLDWIERLKPKRAILTNMHTDLDYDALREALPPHVEPAYDGMRISV